MSVRVVLCEDHLTLRQLVREACTAAGHEIVGETATADEAATLAERHGAVVVVLDLSSGASPADTIRPVAELVPSVAIVAYTGVPAADLGVEASRALAGHVAKTAPLTELLAEIERAAAG
ncbi:MAG: hypothetical protein M3P44_07025 [Actinomycetota bacterium]|nr:hypothetical protein [Actinomycetota bacterium]